MSSKLKTVQYRCPNCSRLLAKLDRRRKRDNQLQLEPDVDFIEPPKQAKQMKCSCGHNVIFLTGEFS